MKLYFKVRPRRMGALLRSFLRRCSVSADLSRAVKFRGSGFLPTACPFWPTAGSRPGRSSPFELPPERRGRRAAERHPGERRL